MKLLLSGDEYCYLYDGHYYVSDTGQTHLNRYLKVFDEIVVAFRTKIASSRDELVRQNLVNSNRVQFINVPFFQGPKQFLPKYFAVKHAISKGIGGCDIAILRIPSTTAFVALQVIKKRKLPYATEVVFDCYDALQTATGISNHFIWKYLHSLQVKACNNAIGVSCVTEKYLQQRYFPKHAKAITSHYSSVELTEDFFLHPRKYPDKSVFRLVHVTNQVQFNGRKGHNELIEVVSRLNSSGKCAEIVFIGEDYFNGIEKLKSFATNMGVADDVTFTGYLNKQELRNELMKADIAILPTRAEGLPRVVIEVMALGLPCITSPVSGNPELINEQFLIGYDDVKGMAEACMRLIVDKSLYERESFENFEKSQQYSAAVLNPRRTMFYKDLINLVKNK